MVIAEPIDSGKMSERWMRLEALFKLLSKNVFATTKVADVGYETRSRNEAT